MSIRDRLSEIQENIIGSEAKVIAVSKKQSIETIKEAYAAGLRDFAENYQQESAEKQRALLGLEICWHFIGSLQSKKLKKIVGNFDWIHSVDRLKILAEIDALSSEKGIQQKILVQVNLAGEASKSGVLETEVDDFFSSAMTFKHVSICGLMLMPPFVENAEDNRENFRKGRELMMGLRSRFPKLNHPEFQHLSMGTSQDYVVAIQEGATMVRIGTQLLGRRA